MTIIIRLINKFLELCVFVVAWLSARDTSFDLDMHFLNWFNNNDTIAMFNDEFCLVFVFLFMLFLCWSRKKNASPCFSNTEYIPMLLSTLVLLRFFLSRCVVTFLVKTCAVHSHIHNRWRWIRWQNQIWHIPRCMQWKFSIDRYGEEEFTSSSCSSFYCCCF